MNTMEGNSAMRLERATEAGGVAMSYYETCRRIEYLASVGMPQVTPFTDISKPQTLTLPEPRVAIDVEPEMTLPSFTASTTCRSSLLRNSKFMMSRSMSRREQEMEKLDKEAAYAAFIRRLERQLDREEEEEMKHHGTLLAPST